MWKAIVFRALLLLSVLQIVAVRASFSRCRVQAYCIGDVWTAKDFDGGALPDAKALSYQKGSCKMLSTDHFYCDLESATFDSESARDVELHDSTGVRLLITSQNTLGVCAFFQQPSYVSIPKNEQNGFNLAGGASGSCVLLSVSTVTV